MSTPVVGIIGVNGTLGAALFKHLAQAHSAGSLRLVVLARAGSKLDSVPEGIEKRTLDLEGGELGAIKQAVKGINVLISAVAAPAIPSQKRLIDALKGSEDLVTFIPSDFGSPWTEADFADPRTAFLGAKEEIYAYAREHGVPITKVQSPVFAVYAFDYGFGGIDVKKNQVTLYDGVRDGAAVFSSLDFIGAGLTRLVTTQSDLRAHVNGAIAFVELEVSGNDIIAALEQAHGAPPTVVSFTESNYQAALDSGDVNGIIAAGVLKKSAKGIVFTGTTVRSVEGFDRKLIDYIKASL